MKPLTFAQVAARADRKVKAFLQRFLDAQKRGDKTDILAYELAFWRGVAACARYFKTGEDNLGL